MSWVGLALVLYASLVLTFHRDSTITPIRVSHEFSLQIYFSIWGEDAAGKPLPKSGPGQLRKAILSQGVLITSVRRCLLSPGIHG